MQRTLFLLITILSITTARAQDSCQHKTYPLVNPLLIQQFQAARCLETVSWQADSTEVDRVNIALGESHRAKTKSPFLLLFSSSQSWDEDQPLYLISKGYFQASHLSIPLDWKGHYFFAILDHQKPELVAIDNTSPMPNIKYRQTCALHY